MSDELREEIARAIGDAKLWPNAWAAMPEAERNFHRHAADAILPIIARVRDEARDDFEDWLRGYDTVLADSYRYNRENGRL